MALSQVAIAEAERILDAAARRLLAEGLDRDPVRSATGGNGRPLDDGTGVDEERLQALVQQLGGELEEPGA
jgi:hypothetical protein